MWRKTGFLERGRGAFFYWRGWGWFFPRITFQFWTRQKTAACGKGGGVSSFIEVRFILENDRNGGSWWGGGMLSFPRVQLKWNSFHFDIKFHFNFQSFQFLVAVSYIFAQNFFSLLRMPSSVIWYLNMRSRLLWRLHMRSRIMWHLHMRSRILRYLGIWLNMIKEF